MTCRNAGSIEQRSRWKWLNLVDGSPVSDEPDDEGLSIPKSKSTQPAAFSATVRAPGVCGELAQGMLGSHYFLVTCPVDFYSRVRVDLYLDPIGIEAPPESSKTAAAVQGTLRSLGYEHLGARIAIANPIPRGKGFGSSSADLAAAIAATGLALGIELTPHQIGQLALEVEPTDGVMFPGIVLFDHREGSVVEELGPPPMVEIVALDFGGEVETLAFNLEDRQSQWRSLQPQTDKALTLVREGLRLGDPQALGRGATLSARAAQEILYKPRLPEVIAFAEAMGAVGVNVAHSGTVIGVLLDATQRRGKSTFRQARQAFPDAEAIHHLRLLGGGVQAV